MTEVFSLGAAAHILALDVTTTGKIRKDGGRGDIRQLIRDGKLAPVDPTQPEHRWTVSAVELERYIAEGPRKPLRRVS